MRQVLVFLLSCVALAATAVESRVDRSRFLIGAYTFHNGYLRSEKCVKELKDCGLDFVWGVPVSWPDVIDDLGRYGLGAIVEGAVEGLGLHDDPSLSERELHPPEEFAAALAEHAEVLAKPAVWRICLCDEPGAKQMGYIGEISALIAETCPGLSAYMCLYPNYASVAENTDDETRSQLQAQTYSDYIDAYCRDVPLDYICYDHYMMFDDPRETADWTKRMYANYQVVADACRRTGRDFWYVPQVNSRPESQRKLRANELRYQAFTAMAFGAVSISWACWSPGWWQYNVYREDGTRDDEQYEKLRTVNFEIRRLATDYMRFRNESTSFVGFMGGPSSYSDSGFSALRTDDGSPLLVGAMAARDGGTRRALFVVAAGDPADQSNAVHRLTFRADDSVTALGSEGEVALVREPDGSRSLLLRDNSCVLLTAEALELREDGIVAFVPDGVRRVESRGLSLGDGQFLIKTGGGTLVVPESSVSQQGALSVVVREGTVEFVQDGAAPATPVLPAALREKAQLWLAADDGARLAGDGNGVERWYDVREREVLQPRRIHAVAEHWNGASAPVRVGNSLYFGGYGSGCAMAFVRPDGAALQENPVEFFAVHGVENTLGNLWGELCPYRTEISMLMYVEELDPAQTLRHGIGGWPSCWGPSKGDSATWVDGLRTDSSRPVDRGVHLIDCRRNTLASGNDYYYGRFPLGLYSRHSWPDDPAYTARFKGGDFLHEIISFTNLLTQAERSLVTAYLAGKWLTRRGEVDKNILVMPGSGVRTGGDGSEVRATQRPKCVTVRSGVRTVGRTAAFRRGMPHRDIPVPNHSFEQWNDGYAEEPAIQLLWFPGNPNVLRGWTPEGNGVVFTYDYSKWKAVGPSGHMAGATITDWGLDVMPPADGTRAVVLCAGTDETVNLGTTVEIPEPGEYELSVSVWGRRGAANGTCEAGLFDSSGNCVADFGHLTYLYDDRIVRQALRAMVPAAGEYRLRFHPNRHVREDAGTVGSGATIALDDVRLTEVGPYVREWKVPDGDFERVAVPGWTFEAADDTDGYPPVGVVDPGCQTLAGHLYGNGYNGCRAPLGGQRQLLIRHAPGAIRATFAPPAGKWRLAASVGNWRDTRQGRLTARVTAEGETADLGTLVQDERNLRLLQDVVWPEPFESDGHRTVTLTLVYGLADGSEATQGVHIDDVKLVDAAAVSPEDEDLPGFGIIIR